MQLAAAPRARENSWLWLAKVLSGVLVLGLLLVHLVVNHFVAQGGLLTYADVLAYYANPLIPLMEGVFLLLVVTHALLGVRGILLDLELAPALIRVLDGALVAVGVGAVGYGVWLLQAIASLAQA
jgi:succinate dehydrogenase / fumarate reductase membrane anchor subunit